MKKIIIVLIILSLFLITGCVKEKLIETPIGCEPPRMMHGADCCLDTDNSGTCDMIEEALKRTGKITEEKKAEESKVKTPDQCIDMSQWFTCEDLDITYDQLLQRGLIQIQLKNNREGIVVIKEFKFPNLPSCNKELNWNRDLTGMLQAESSKYVIECNSLKNIDILETTIEMGVNFYEEVTGLDPGLAKQYLPEVEQVIKGKIKGST